MYETYGVEAFERFRAHPSDTMRGLAAFVLARLPGVTFADSLCRVRPLADDDHFGVREWAWLALRDLASADIVASVELLAPWSHDESANVRRYASELTRPRGVWCPHIERLKEHPDIGLPILDP